MTYKTLSGELKALLGNMEAFGIQPEDIITLRPNPTNSAEWIVVYVAR